MKKILFLLCSLLGTVGAWADVLTLTPSNGTYVTSSGNYVNSITFSTTPAITVTASANNMDKRLTDTYLQWHSGTSGSSTYTMSVEGDCVITGYSVTGEANTSAQTLTAGSESHEFAVGTSSSFEVTGLKSSTVSFVQTGENASGLKITSISVTVLIPSAEQKAAYATAAAWKDLILGTNTGLMSSTNQWVSEAADASEGWLERLTDGNLTNYFHTDWHGAFSGTHYIEATLPEPTNSLLLYYCTRSSGTGCPTLINVSGSTDGSDWVDNIATINESDMPRTASTEYLTKGLSFGASYSHFRFYVPSTNSGTNSWFCLAEANLYLPTSAMAEAMTLSHVDKYDLTNEQIARIAELDTELRSTIISVTYNLYEADGTTLVGSETVEQEKNSAISIPSSWGAFTYYNYATEGSIGNSDCTIKVTRTLKDGYVISLDGLSNDKCYNIRNNRGTWAVGSGATDVNSTVELGLAFLASDTKQQFAFITYEGKVYLYSVGEGKFAYVDGNKLSLTADVTSAVEASPVTFQTSTASSANAEPIIVTVGGQMYGVSTGMSPDIFKYNVANDGGNSAIIIEAGSFDASSAVAALEAYFHPINCYDRVEEEVLPYLMDGGGNPSPTIGKPFGLSSDAATSIVTTYMTQLNNKQFTMEEYEAILAAKNAGIIYPSPRKFYLVKNNYNGKYMRVTASGTRGTVFADLTAEEAAKDASAHFTFVNNNSHLYMSSQGEYLNWVYGTMNGYEGYTSTNFDKYVHFANPAPGVGAFSIAYGNGVGEYAGYLYSGFYALKSNESTVVAGSTTNESDPLALWTFEEVTDLTISISAAGYATLYLPFPVTIPSGVKAYAVSSLTGGLLNLTEIETTIPAGTPVILEGEANTYTFAIADEVAAYAGDNLLTGCYFMIPAPNGSYILQKQDKVGFYEVDIEAAQPKIPANRAYLPAQGGSGVKAFFFGGGEDAIKSVFDGVAAGEVYDLSGRKLSKLQRGVNIVNGKKVIAK